MRAFYSISRWGASAARASDMEIHAREIIEIREQINDILADCTGKDLGTIRRDTERDFYMSPDEALEYGLIDEIIQPTGIAQSAEAAG